MLKLTTPPNSKDSHPGRTNLRPDGPVPNFAPRRHLVSEGFLANLKCLLTERGGTASGDEKGSPFLAQHPRTSFVDNLKEHFRPAPKFTGDTVHSLRGIASPGIKIESQPLYLSVFRNIRDIIVPPNLPPLELTSKPVDVPEIWSKHRRLSAANAVSLIVHVTFIVLVLVFTVRQVTTLDPVKPVTILIAPPAPGAAPPPPAAPAAAPAATHRAVYTKRKSFFVKGKLIAPSATPTIVSAKRSIDDVAAPDLSPGGVPGGDPAGIPGGVLGGVAGGLPGGVPGDLPGAPPPPPIAKQAPTGPVRVGGNVKRPKAIYTPLPELPDMARRANLAGTVTLEAVIDEHGNVIKLRGVSGSGLLIAAAIKAVTQWKFEPTYLNGVPVAVEMEVEVKFHLAP